jgi:hypothetical protein
MQSAFQPKSLKTFDGAAYEMTHNSVKKSPELGQR